MPRRVFLAHLLAIAGLPALGFGAPAHTPADAADIVLLLASERMGDPRFRETVLMVMRHGPGGPLGVVLNRPTTHARGEALPGLQVLPGGDEPIFYGGPVSGRALYYIARFAIAPPEVLTLAAGIYMGLDMHRLAAMLEAGVRPLALRIYAGYAGWAPGQLENELSRQDWHLLPFDEAALFDDQPQTLYARMLAQTRLLPA